ncbi:MAG: hypothetical protein JJU37_17140 [Balneolaceae bacterium]|nr:hypothetical protein [Balneolaceae bacterium]
MKIITLGSGATGSSAIEDYLFGRGDIYRSRIKKEFRLIQDPGGISDLHAAISSGFHMNRASAAIEAFIDLCDRYGNSKSGHPKGLNYRSYVKNYDEKVSYYVDKITAVNYNGFPFCERSKMTKWESYFYEKKRKKAKKEGSKPKLGTVRLPVIEDIFLKETEKFLASLFEYDDQEKSPIVIEQGGSFWAPLNSTVYFGDQRKVIVVTRDPRDIFSEILDDGYAYPGHDAEVFCDWFDNMMKHVNYSEWNSDIIIHLKFEDFVLDYKNEKKNLDRRLGVPDDIPSTYDPDKSAKNIGKYKMILSDKEAKTIEDRLNKYLHY